MTRHNTKIWAKPSLGFTEPGETIILDISANNPFAPEANIEPSLLILATTCEVIEESKPTDLKSFWNVKRELLNSTFTCTALISVICFIFQGVKSIGSTAFVEVVETKLFFFSHTRYVPFGVKFELGGTDTEETTEWSSLSLSDSNSNFPDKEDTYSLVSSGSSLSDYEQHPFDLNEDESLIPEESEKLAEDYSIPSTKDLELMPYTSKLTDKLFESHKSIRKIANCLFYVFLFLVIYYILYLMFIQKNFRKI